MSLFARQTPYQKERAALLKREKAFLSQRAEKQDSALNRKLAEVVPATLQETLDAAFFKAFQLVFEKGTSAIELTYRREDLEKTAQANHQDFHQTRSKKSIRAFSKGAKSAGNTGIVFSGASGIGLGLLGVGIPDIPVFTATLLRTVYEIALKYGHNYDDEKERYLILLLIQGAVSYGDTLRQVDAQVNRLLQENTLPQGYNQEEQIKKTAAALSKELLYMKFLQGIPVVGVVGGIYDVVYMKNITTYAAIKYQRRFLFKG